MYSSSLRLTLTVATLLVLLSSVLMALRVEQVLQGLAQARSLWSVHKLGDEIEGGFRLGLGLSAQANLAGWLQRQQAQEDSLAAARVIDEEGGVVAQVGADAAFTGLAPLWTRQLLGRGAASHPPLASVTRHAGSMSYVGVPLIDASGQRVGAVWCVHDRTALHQSAWSMLRLLWPWATGAALALGLLTGALWAAWTSSAPDTRRRAWRATMLLALAFGATLVTLGALAWKARELARPLVLAQVDESVRVSLRLAQGQIERALALGIPVDRLAGLEEMLQSQLQATQEIALLALRQEDGPVSAFAQRDEVGGSRETGMNALQRGGGAGLRLAAQPVEHHGNVVARLVAGTRLDDVDARLRSMLIDLLFTVVVSLVLARELLGLDVQRGMQRSLRANGEVPDRMSAAAPRERVRLRLIVFLAALSDELLRPFFAVFASEATPLVSALSPTLHAGVPVATFMLALAFAQPLGPWIIRRVDIRRAMAGVALTAAALALATGRVHDGAVLALLRAGSGATYGLLLILSQAAILRVTPPRQRARGLAEVAAAIVAAGVCGPALGGVLEERLGSAMVFAACAACLLAAAAVGLALAPLPNSRVDAIGVGGWQGLTQVLRHGRVMAVTWLAAVPARLAAAALLVVVTPLYLAELGETASVSGRVQLLYFLAFMVLAPWAARLSDRRGQRRSWIIGGCVLSAAACAAPWALGGVAGIATCCATLGAAHAVLSAPQLAFVTEAFERMPHDARGMVATPEQALAAFRFIERFGSIAAPFAVAIAVSWFGLGGAVGVVGVLLLAGALGVAAVLFDSSEHEERHVTA